ncbi:MAG: hypothetical protein GY696_10460, partial [Gammaproteobacteria bacterium]|nr:hypothetical protein [Gammaproteobacteria bacterium]
MEKSHGLETGFLGSPAIAPWHPLFRPLLPGLFGPEETKSNSFVTSLGQYCAKKAIFHHRKNGILVSEFLLTGIHPNPGPGLSQAEEILPAFLFSTNDSLGSDSILRDADGTIPDDFGQLNDSDVDPIPISTNGYPVFFSANVDSLTSKLELNIKPLVEHYKFPLLAIQESKLDSSISCAELAIPDYSLFRKDRTRNGGGVCLYVHQKLRPKLVKFRSAPEAEIVAVEIKLKRQTFLVASIYKPPATCTVDFVSNLSDFLSECANPRHEILLFGDTNVDALQPVFLDRFAGFLNTYRLQQIVSDPTHKGHIIDQVFASSRRLFSQVGTGPPIEKH